MFFQGIRTSITKKPYSFVLFQGVGPDPLPLSLSGSAHGDWPSFIFALVIRRSLRTTLNIVFTLICIIILFCRDNMSYHSEMLLKIVLLIMTLQVVHCQNGTQARLLRQTLFVTNGYDYKVRPAGNQSDPTGTRFITIFCFVWFVVICIFYVYSINVKV